MTAETVPAGTAPAADAPSEWELMNRAESALNTTKMRAQAVLSIFDQGDFYDMAASKSDEALALLTAAECLLKDAATAAQSGMEAIEAAGRAKRRGVTHA